MGDKAIVSCRESAEGANDMATASSTQNSIAGRREDTVMSRDPTFSSALLREMEGRCVMSRSVEKPKHG